ncbi:MAG: PaaI family thioesterase [Actinobacteria bacterium]|nr:PaaI family thioesterase [Actinomycetota bacterium]
MPREMDKWLGDGGMPIIGQFGGAFTAYGDGWVEASWTPTDLCCNPAGIVQAGVNAVMLDAAMNFAMLAALDRGDRGATLEMKVSTLRPAQAGDDLRVRGEVVRLAKQVAYLEAWAKRGIGETEETVSHATGTFIVRRAD